MQKQAVCTTMKDNDTVPSNANDLEYTVEEIRGLYYQAVHSRRFRSGAEKIRIDSKWTTLFQKLNGHGNSDVLNGFKLRLEIDEENEQEEICQE
jgi:hypothetical protein